MGDLAGRHVVVTGATGGLGGAVAMTLLERGATCHLPMRESSVPDGVPWKDHGKVEAYGSLSLDDEGAVRAFYAGLPRLWASVHLVGGFTMAPFTQTPLADLQRMLTLNVVTAFLCCQGAVGAMGEGGRIVNVAARQVLQPAGGAVAYAASKGAVASLTTSLAAELRERGILVNAVVPSIIDTPANRAAMPRADHGRWPAPAELAEAIAWLVSPTNTVTSGALVPVFGRA